MNKIRFDNDTENFETISTQSFGPISVVKSNIVYNHTSKRLGIPQQLRQRFIEYDKALLSFNYETNELFIDFKPTENLSEENFEYKLCQIRTTGRGYYLTLPNKWVCNITPKKAQLVVQETKKSLYKVIFYG